MASLPRTRLQRRLLLALSLVAAFAVADRLVAYVGSHARPHPHHGTHAGPPPAPPAPPMPPAPPVH